MGINRGKQFEAKFKQDWLRTVPNSFIYRLPDQVSGAKFTSQNISDFICYSWPNLFCIECKSINGNTFPIHNFTQYDRMKSFIGVKGIRLGVVIWFIEHYTILYVPVNTITKLINDGKKSVNIKTILNEEYDVVEIPVIKKKVFLDADYSVLLNLEEGW